MGARETALNALIACRKSGAWSNGVLKEYIQRDRLDSRDAALATRLCYGVLQNRQKLDFYLQQLLTGKLKDLHPAVRDILHLGLYQIYELDKIPDSAAVNESVTLAKKYNKNPKAASLVNGVLRNAVRSQGKLKQPTSYADKYSHPDPLIALLKANLPKGKLEPMLVANNASPETTIQVNTLRISAAQLMLRLEQEHVSVKPHGWMKDCLVLSGTGSIENLPSFKEGLFYVQDPAAKLSVLCAKLPKEDIRVLDCCSAPGGKSFAAAIAMRGKGQITSCDVHAHKTGLIENGASRLGLTNITVRQQDATVNVSEWVDTMDAVIADVPCSGLGIIRKKPDIRYKNLEEIAETKAGIFKEGGHAVVYRGTPGVEAVFERIAAEKGITLHKADFEGLRNKSLDLFGQTFDCGERKDIELPLLGEHQMFNASVVLSIMDALIQQGWKITEEQIREGLRTVTWPGRFDIVSRDPLFIIDGGHNPQCIEALVKNIQDYLKDRRVIALVGVLADKDYAEMFRPVMELVEQFVCITPDSPRKLEAADLARYLRGVGAQAEGCGDMDSGIRRCLELAGKDGAVLCFGSLYSIGAVKASLDAVLGA